MHPLALLATQLAPQLIAHAFGGQPAQPAAALPAPVAAPAGVPLAMPPAVASAPAPLVVHVVVHYAPPADNAPAPKARKQPKGGNK